MKDYLGGSRNAFLKMSPDRLSVDTERRCGRQMGAHVLHLGGGVGSNEDSVFDNKARFRYQIRAPDLWGAGVRWVAVWVIVVGFLEGVLRGLGCRRRVLR